MPRKYPPLTPAQVQDIVRKLGFTYRTTDGSHEHWEHTNIDGKPRLVTIDLHYAEFDEDLIKSMIAQFGVSREVFYTATRATSKKINLPWRKRS